MQKLLLILVCLLSPLWIGDAVAAKHQSLCPDKSKFMGDAERHKILKLHTEFRTQLAEGKAAGHRGETLPPAKNLYIMRWSCFLEVLARVEAENCSRYYNYILPYGQNTMYFSNSDMIDYMGKMELIKFAVEQWAMPAQHYGVSRSNKYKDERLYTFANMAYAGIREIGCHYEQCNDVYGFVKDAVFVCVYGTEVPTNALLYEKRTEPGCTASECRLAENSTCLGLLCDAPYDPNNML